MEVWGKGKAFEVPSSPKIRPSRDYPSRNDATYASLNPHGGALR
jgi:hypothetical protein